MEAQHGIKVLWDEPECTFSCDTEYLSKNKITRIEYKDTGMILEFRDDALNFFKHKAHQLGGMCAALLARAPDNLQLLQSVGGVTIIAEGSRRLNAQECAAVFIAYEQRTQEPVELCALKN